MRGKSIDTPDKVDIKANNRYIANQNTFKLGGYGPKQNFLFKRQRENSFQAKNRVRSEDQSPNPKVSNYSKGEW